MNISEIDELSDMTGAEKIKLKMEYEHLRLERLKIFGTTFSIVIPLLVAGVTIIYGLRSEIEKSKSNFQIKAIEIVMSESSSHSATNKAIVLSELFPNLLPNDFGEKMEAMYGRRYNENPKK